MPQMAPLNWLILFLFFTALFLIFNVMNFYSFLYLPKKKKSMKKTMQFNWKW
uniref:ATP synthase F0 subunit 8 n=1 Tax=Turanoclytus namaganensis TaxID=2874582 RepID=UPI001EE11AF9|nr:ATP synthase F0 subunit 8 [Turanoclytus namaganensis]UHY95168.1 ATP synthase F0 subunit 8 [Turanoclytus namaganensis]